MADAETQIRQLLSGQLRRQQLAQTHTHKSTVHARARQETSQTLTSGQWNQIEFDVEDFDPNGNYDAVTNFVYTCPVDGIYMVSTSVQVEKTGGTAGAFQALVAVFKNDVEDIRGTRQNYQADMDASKPIGVHVSGIISCSAGDELDVRVHITVNDGTPRTETLSAGLVGNYFTVFLVR